jgi:hypothetical protein
MRDQDFAGVRWNGHWVAPDVPEFVIGPTSVGSDLPPAGFSRSQPGRNAVAVLVAYYGHPNAFWQPAASSGVMGRDAAGAGGPTRAGLAGHRRPVAGATVPRLASGGVQHVAGCGAG